MSLEDEIQSLKVAVELNTEAIIKLTAAMSGATTVAKANSAGAPPANDEGPKKRGPKPKTDTAPPAPKDDLDDDGFGEEPALTLDDVRSKILEVRDTKGKDVAADIVKKHHPEGLVKVAEIPADKFRAAYNDAVAALKK